ncbi:M23 family peptidase [Marinitenerispora sediminis]|uniref:M23 family peptidase n=2 Tax=Marinitenerispora sediminis TaxID=1931232 RepID=A0A368T9V2_9ACTN|nr:M23 family peptidase [Marinitenerispora sediminis]RCV58234.1 M23 family peptidase [Marinitenerispora sediminis]RCV61495.1 M23 family peptidase [Marinitenerispora sediminis]
MWAGTAVLVLGGHAGLSWWGRLPLFAVALLVYLRLGRVDREPRTVLPPVRGRWMAVSSPADQVPSQGTHAYGQTYAVALVAEPADGTRPDIGWRPLTRPPEDFPGFGAPVHAPADGTVLRVHDRQRDHRSRNSWPWLLGMVAETAVRELRGPAGLLGNHVVLDIGGGCYALLGHLRRGSVTVAAGDRVTAGQQIARCGNSGACTEPQVRFQLMEHRWPLVAAGVPFRWAAPAPASTDAGGAGTAPPETWRPFTV